MSLLDLVPTVLDLAGVTPERLDTDGVSLAELAAGTHGDRGAPVVAEYLAEGVTAPAVMLRSGRYKLIRCPGDPDLLYDLEADPHEIDDLTGRPEHAGTHEALGAEADARWDLADLDVRVRASQLDRLAVAPALATGIRTDWDFSPHLDGGTVFVRSHTNMYELQRRSRLEA